MNTQEADEYLAKLQALAEQEKHTRRVHEAAQQAIENHWENGRKKEGSGVVKAFVKKVGEICESHNSDDKRLHDARKAFGSFVKTCRSSKTIEICPKPTQGYSGAIVVGKFGLGIRYNVNAKSISGWYVDDVAKRGDEVINGLRTHGFKAKADELEEFLKAWSVIAGPDGNGKTFLVPLSKPIKMARDVGEVVFDANCLKIGRPYGYAQVFVARKEELEGKKQNEQRDVEVQLGRGGVQDELFLAYCGNELPELIKKVQEYYKDKETNEAAALQKIADEFGKYVLSDAL